MINDHTVHFNDVTWGSWYLKSLVTWMFVQQLVQANYNGNIKAPNYSKLHITGPFWVESPHKAPVMRDVFSFYDVMTCHLEWRSMLNTSHSGLIVLKQFWQIIWIKLLFYTQRIPTIMHVLHILVYIPLFRLTHWPLGNLKEILNM